ncbi:MAG: non-ribosomal peptide synthetase [Rhizomicrobium sp.]
MVLGGLLASGNQDDVAIAGPGLPSLSYGALRAHVAALGRYLAGHGISRRDRVALVMQDGADMAVALLGVAAHAVAAPLNPRCTESEFERLLRDLRPRVLMVERIDDTAAAVARRLGIPVLALAAGREQAGVFERGDSEGAPSTGAAPDDYALLLHTSGTTARPKLVPLTHANLCASARNVAASLKLTREDRGLHIMPLFHVHGFVAGLLAPLSTGGSVYCTGGFTPRDFATWLSTAKPSWLTAVPTMHQAILAWSEREPATASAAGLRLLRSCSAALPPSVAKGLERVFGVPVIEAYAMTEAAHQITSNPLPPAQRRFGSVGVAAGPEVAILDPQGRRLAPGTAGEVAIRGANVMTGYLDNPDANAAAFVDGWFRTGDVGTLDEDGYLRLVGRFKEMINRGGEKIAPVEIESLLLGHPAVAQAVVFAAPHSTLGEEVAAAIVTKAGIACSARDLQEFLLRDLSLAKIPRRILFLPELPKGPTGKLVRIGLAEMLGLAAEPSLPPLVASSTPQEHALAQIWRESMGAKNIGVNQDFFDLGGNSLTALRIIDAIREAMGVEISLSDFLAHPTIVQLSLVITERRLIAMAPDAAERLLAGVERARAS